MWECCQEVGGAGWVLFDPKLAGGRASPDIQSMLSISAKACTGSWVLDTGVTEHGYPSLCVSRKDGVTDGVGRASRGNEQGRKHKIVSVSNANFQFCDCRTLNRLLRRVLRSGLTRE